MPHVSPKELKPETLEKISKKLLFVLEKAYDRRQFGSVFYQLTTETERIMLSKRLAIVILLLGDTPQHRISEALKVSPTTVMKFAKNMDRGKYDSIRKIVASEKVDIEKVVWLLMTAGGILPPRAGGKYWRSKGYKSHLQK